MNRLSSTVPTLSARPRGVSGGSARPGVLPLTGVILNPRSHRNTGARPDLPQHPDILIVMPRTKPELEAALADFANRGIGLLAIGGGDGTVRDVLTRGGPVFGDHWPEILVLPRGKTNALALDLGLPRKWPLDEALEAARIGRTAMRQPLVVESLDAPRRQRFGFILGAGVFNTAIETGQLAHRYGAFQGFAVGVTAVSGFLQAIFGLGTSGWRKVGTMRLYAGAGDREIAHSGVGAADRRFLAAFSTLSVFPAGMRPFSDPAGCDAINYLVLDAPLRRVVAMLPAILFGKGYKVTAKLGVRRGSASQFTLKLGDSFILDGESFPPGAYRVTTGPQLRFVVP